ncbi:MAG TPA: MBL fold metallo-hydrolase [Flavobacteriales bacterium]|mgnify:CR=1 FL=1|jgi:glyoxylase-like metal-dependent hydrolase (beta-lactamase superfamily II)/rhodanese-related sulfurtransferase|nr:MBL fold metallo-hydrolase [Flavobacteriales bacterium]
MKVEQIYTGCLAQGAYYIECCDEAVVIDPLREVQQYIDRAEAGGKKIKYIFETHFHADFVSGHVTLAEKTGAPIVFGPNAQPKFQAHIAEHGEVFQVGKVTIEVIHTPGHTMESTTYLLRDKAGKPHAIFTGDTLFLGDVGRPDLAQKSADMTQEMLAGTLFDSLRNKLMTLPDEVIVYPGHGAGSACGKNMSSETVGTLGDQKANNYALRADMTKSEFVAEVTNGLLPPPAYFPLNVKLNKEGYVSIDEVLAQGGRGLSPAAFEAAANETNAVILDVRSMDAFATAHVPRSTFIGLDGNFAPWVGAMIVDVKQPILLVTDQDKVEEAITRLSRVGFDHVLGYLEGGIAEWKKAGMEVDAITSVGAEEFSRLRKNSDIKVIDVRKPGEYLSEHIVEAESIPLVALNGHLAEIPAEGDFYLHCLSGYRSLIAMSILKARGFHNGTNVLGGFNAIKETDTPLSDYVCPSTL